MNNLVPFNDEIIVYRSMYEDEFAKKQRAPHMKELVKGVARRHRASRDWEKMSKRACILVYYRSA